MKKLKADILKSDMLVFVTPLYYYGFSSQLKIVIDRFCAFNSSLHAKHMRSALIAAAWNSADWTFGALSELQGRRHDPGRRLRNALHD